MTESLLALQRTWIAALQDPAPGQELATLLSNLSGGQRSAEAAFAVYVNNVRSTLIQALTKSFPVTKRLLGVSLFNRAALHSLKHYPPSQGDLGEYGQKFPLSVLALSATERDLDAEHVANVAQLEWVLDGIARAPREPALELADLQSFPVERWQELRFKLAPQAKIMQIEATLREALMQAADFEPDLLFCLHSAGPAEAMPQAATTHHCLVVARDQQVDIYPLGVMAEQWLQYIVNGQSLGEGTDAVLKSHPNFELLPLLLWLIGTQTLTLNN